MGGGKKIIVGAILGGASVALKQIGNAIFTATGTSEGALLHYGALIELVSFGLLALGGLIVLSGVLEIVYRRWKDSGEEDEPRNSRSRRPPSNRRDRPRNQPRS